MHSNVSHLDLFTEIFFEQVEENFSAHKYLSQIIFKNIMNDTAPGSERLFVDDAL